MPDASARQLLDGYLQIFEQGKALKVVGIHSHIFILLDVSCGKLVSKIVGRKLNPMMGKVYLLTFASSEKEEIASMLVQYFDVKEEKVKAYVDTCHVVKSLIGECKDIVKSMDGNCPKLILHHHG